MQLEDLDITYTAQLYGNPNPSASLIGSVRWVCLSAGLIDEAAKTDPSDS